MGCNFVFLCDNYIFAGIMCDLLKLLSDASLSCTVPNIMWAVCIDSIYVLMNFEYYHIIVIIIIY